MQAKTLKTFLLGLGIVGLLAGSYGIYEVLGSGTASTNLTSSVPWGLGVVVYLLFLGFSGGGLLVAGLVHFWGQKQFEHLSGVAAWCVVVSEVCAGVAIAADLGHWERVYRFLLSPSYVSPMAWMFVLFAALLIVYVCKIVALLAGNSARAHRLTLISMPVALLFYLTNGYIFGMITAQPLWGGAFTPVWFVLAALLSGGALVGLAAWLLEYDDALIQRFGTMILRLLFAFTLFEVLFLLTQLQAGDEAAQKALAAMLSGAGRLNFWGLHVLAGIILPAALLWGAASARRSGWAFLAIVVTFAAARWNFVIPAQSVDQLPGLASAFTHARLSLHYVPSIGEWLVAFFVSGLCLVSLFVGPRLIPALFSKEGRNYD